MSKTETKSLQKVQTELVDGVMKRVQEFQSRGELHLPADYSAPNALKSAWLKLQDTVDKNGKPALEVCTRHSIANAMLSMVVQGLNVDKSQGYLIIYGRTLCFQRSYFGAASVAKRLVDTMDDIYSEVVYEDDTLKYGIMHGKKTIQEHTQELQNIDKGKIVGAYAVAMDKSGNVMRTEIMTIDEIKQAWKQSAMKPVDEKGNIKTGSTHDKFTASMAKKTVIGRLAKWYINTSSDTNLMASIARQNDIDNERAAAEEEIAEHANTEVIDIETDPREGQIGTAETNIPPSDQTYNPDPPPDHDPSPMSDEEKQEIIEQEKAEAEGPDY